MIDLFPFPWSAVTLLGVLLSSILSLDLGFDIPGVVPLALLHDGYSRSRPSIDPAPIGAGGYAEDVASVAHESRECGFLQEQAAIRGFTSEAALSQASRPFQSGNTGSEQQQCNKPLHKYLFVSYELSVDLNRASYGSVAER